MSDAWPQPLKEWVAKCLGQMTDINRAEAQSELRQVIAEAFANKTLWSTDWQGVQLQSLLPKVVAPTPKRKFEDKPIVSKKKKSSISKHTSHNPSSYSPVDSNDQAALNRRAQRFQREHEIEKQKTLRGNSFGSGSSTPHAGPSNFVTFNRINSSRSGTPSTWEESNERDWDRLTIVGTSQQLFKDYLRLTSDPDPKDVRPYSVLQRTLVALKQRWKESNDYPWICNQFKSLRQDLTVQRIKNEFTVQVYEIHGRMALEASDMVEYNQCQAMLKQLYELGIPGCNDEFTAYRVLLLLHGMNRSELNLLVGQLTSAQKNAPAIKHALDVQKALSTTNYHAFFELYLNAPNMGAYIMDHFVDRERARALVVITKAYLQLDVVFIRDKFAFDGSQQTCDFLSKHQAVFRNPNDPEEKRILDCKASHPSLAHAYENKYRKAVIVGAI